MVRLKIQHNLATKLSDMKTQIHRIIILIVTLISSCSASICAMNESCSFFVILYEYLSEYEEVNNLGDRSTGKSGNCIIDKSSGIQSSLFADGEIECYEIWDWSGEQLISRLTDEDDFIESIKMIKTDCLIRLISERYVYVGLIQME